jgi:hypothetical protein
MFCEEAGESIGAFAVEMGLHDSTKTKLPRTGLTGVSTTSQESVL